MTKLRKIQLTISGFKDESCPRARGCVWVASRCGLTKERNSSLEPLHDFNQ